MKIMRMFKIKGQSTAEYAIIIGVIVAMAIAMQTYVKRGLQGRFKDAVDEVGEANIATGEGTSVANPFTGNQYEPDYLESSYTTTTNKDIRTVSGAANAPVRGVDMEVTQSGSQTMSAP